MQIHTISQSPRQLMAEAAQLTGIGNIHDSSIEEPLTILLKSLNTESQLSEEGAVGMRRRLLRILGNRLRMLRDFKAHPEIDDEQIVRPVFLTGAGRTGSTKLHKMLAASGDFRYLPFWQGHNLSLISGDRTESPAQRIADTDDYINWFNARAPLARQIHAFETHEPEEEVLIMEHFDFGPYMMAFAFVPTFVGWSMQFCQERLAFIKQGLKYLQWQFPEQPLPLQQQRPWILKCPLHFGFDPLLANVFPDALFVATHRDPTVVISSQISLIENYCKAYSDVEHPEVFAAMMMEGTPAGADQFMANREQFPALPCLDVSYSELTRDVAAVLDKIYRHAGMPLAQSSLAKMLDWERNNAMHKLGRHSHSLADYGIDSDQLRQRMATYMDRFGQYF